jgi:integrase
VIGDTLVYLARWRDPRTGRERELSLLPLGLATQEARRSWAIQKSRTLAGERAALQSGAAPLTPDIGVRDSVEDFLRRTAEKRRPRTVECFRTALAPFLSWAEKTGLRILNHLRPEYLSDLKDTMERARRTRATPKGRRGERGATNDCLSPATTNSRLREIRVFLQEQRRLGRTPLLDRDAVTDRLRSVPGERPALVFLRPHEVRRLLEAALCHDRELFVMTREEKSRGIGPHQGRTRRYPATAPFVLTVLLAGFRLGEAQALRWEYFYPDTGEIILPSSATKTRHSRSVDLRVSPSLMGLLQALRLRTAGPYVFGGEAPLTKDAVVSAHWRLVRKFGALAFSFQGLRQTCATVLCCANGIYAGAGAFWESRRLGHSIVVAEKRYVGVLRDLPQEARTIEAALGIEDLAAEIVREAQGIVEGVAHAHG